MIKILKFTEKDKRKLDGVEIDKSLLKDDFFDYSKVIVKKPWGYEYLMFENEGHDVLKIENKVRCYNAITDFFKEKLG